MATYKQPKKVASPVVGADDIKKTLRDTDVSVANLHSNVYPPTKPRASKSVAQARLPKV